jgi:hypothetical protein
VKTLRRPASLQRRRVAGETPSTRLASERPTQSGSRDAERVTKPTQIYVNIADSLTVSFSVAEVLARVVVSPNVDSSARLLANVMPDRWPWLACRRWRQRDRNGRAAAVLRSGRSTWRGQS